MIEKKSDFCTKHMLWVLIRSADALLMSTHNVCYCGNLKKKYTNIFAV